MKRRNVAIILVGVILLAVLVLFRVPVDKPMPELTHYLDDPSALRLVEVMSGRSNGLRRDILKKALDHATIPYQEEKFTDLAYRGENIVVELGRGKRQLLFMAHTDRVDVAPGANDNASCVAAGLEALKFFSQTPPKNLTVRFVFTDGEESGLRGAKNYVDNHDLSNIVGVVSFEMCGIGNAFGIWDVAGPATGSPIVRALQMAGETLGVYSGIHGAVPRFGSDHRIFAVRGLAAVGVTMLPKKDEQKLRDYVANPNNPIWLLNFTRPKIFQTYHTSGDVPANIDPAALDMATRLMIETARVMAQITQSAANSGVRDHSIKG